MYFFDHIGRDPYEENRFRLILVTVLLALCAVLLFPLTLLALFFWALGRWPRLHRTG